jgi:hypothetical protein
MDLCLRNHHSLSRRFSVSRRDVGLGLLCNILFRSSHMGSHSPSHKIVRSWATCPSGSLEPFVALPVPMFS